MICSSGVNMQYCLSKTRLWNGVSEYLPSLCAAPPSVTVFTKMPSFSRPMSAPAPIPMMLMPRPSLSERRTTQSAGGELQPNVVIVQVFFLTFNKILKQKALWGVEVRKKNKKKPNPCTSCVLFLSQTENVFFLTNLNYCQKNICLRFLWVFQILSLQ